MLKKTAMNAIARYGSSGLLILFLSGCAQPRGLALPWMPKADAVDTEQPTQEQPPEPPAPAAAEKPAEAPAVIPPPPPTKPVYAALQLGADAPDPGSLPALGPGSKGKPVQLLQEMLTEAGFYRGPIDGVYARHTRAAIMAAQKALGLPLKSRWHKEDWRALLAYQGPDLPARSAEPDRVEVDLDQQLLYLIKADGIVAILPISSGNNKPYLDQYNRKVKAVTPLGDYEIYRRLNGWRESYLGRMYRPWYFHEGYAVHGSGHVPPTPASHGCVRVTMWDADFLADELALGMPLHIWVDGGASTIEADKKAETMLSKSE
jgi:peptidoglycan hydrolase-like protein with peptidoglycan-binding domain